MYDSFCFRLNVKLLMGFDARCKVPVLANLAQGAKAREDQAVEEVVRRFQVCPAGQFFDPAEDPLFVRVRGPYPPKPEGKKGA